MVLLNDVFEVAATANDNGPPPRIFLAQETQHDMAPAVTVECYFAGPTVRMSRDRLPEEGPRGVPAAIGAKQQVDGATLVDSPIEVVPPAVHGDRSFIDAPRGIDAARVSSPSLLELRHASSSGSRTCSMSWQRRKRARSCSSPNGRRCSRSSSSGSGGLISITPGWMARCRRKGDNCWCTGFSTIRPVACSSRPTRVPPGSIFRRRTPSSTSICHGIRPCWNSASRAFTGWDRGSRCGCTCS